MRDLSPLPATAAVDRRTMLVGLTGFSVTGAALPMFPAATSAATTDDLPLLRMHRQFVHLMQEGRRIAEKPVLTEADYEASDAAIDAAFDLMDESADLRPTTLAGALAALAWARLEFGRYHVEECDKPTGPDRADRWMLAMLDGALDVLRQTVDGGRA